MENYYQNLIYCNILMADDHNFTTIDIEYKGLRINCRQFKLKTWNSRYGQFAQRV